MESFLEAEHLLDACSTHVKLLLLLDALHHVLDQLAGRNLSTLLFNFLQALLVLLLFGGDCCLGFPFLLKFFIFILFFLLLSGSLSLALTTLFFFLLLDL